jgi:hypothetical protein
MKKIIFLLSTILITHSFYAQMVSNIIQHSASGIFGSNGTTSAQSIVTNSISHFNDFISTQRNATSFLDDFGTLSTTECSPDFSSGSNTAMTATCSENSACHECYDKAVQNMDFFRRQLARASCIYQNTKNFTTSAVAFGDNTSGVHAVAGIVWQRERAKIMQSLNTLKGTYDRKYTEFIKGLKDALIEFDACENKYGSGDWFAKSGFIYFEFMKERYKRTD